MTATTEKAAWEPVIGLEVHVELATATKLFCGCRNEFGAEPNTNVCPVCLGLPGSLPVLNEKAVELALRLGEALQFTMPPQSIFHRKNYFYPDMPKNFQTSQYDEPICVEGEIEVDGVRVRITARISKRTPARRCTSVAAVASTTPSTRSSTTTAPACRCSRSCRSPTSSPPSRRAPTSPSCARRCSRSVSPT